MGKVLLQGAQFLRPTVGAPLLGPLLPTKDEQSWLGESSPKVASIYYSKRELDHIHRVQRWRGQTLPNV